MDIPTSSPYPMIPMDDALRMIADKLSALDSEEVNTTESLHRILSDPVHSPIPHPSFRASVKDGYAITLPPPSSGLLRVISESHAGGSSPPALQLGEAAYVTTGAPVPEGAHAVVMVERCSRDGDLLSVEKWPAVGTDIREIGTDVVKGQLLLPAGTTIGAAELGILIGSAVPRVKAVTKPVIGVLSTGDELLNADEVSSTLEKHDGMLPFGRVVDSNRPMLLASVEESLPFCKVIDLGIVSDEYDIVRESLRDAMNRCHVVITSGGVSMGKRDVIKPILEEIATVHFGRVIMKPGKPLTFATASATRCFVGLPGNPVSCFVCFHLAVAVAARRLAGFDDETVLGKPVEVYLGHDIRLDAERPEYHRASLKWVQGKGYEATSTGKQASSRLLSARSADALLALPAREGVLTAGTVVAAYIVGTV